MLVINYYLQPSSKIIARNDELMKIGKTDTLTVNLQKGMYGCINKCPINLNHNCP